MKVNIESINVKIGKERDYVCWDDFNIIDTIKGDVKLHISGDQISKGIYLRAEQIIDVCDISKESQQKLISVIREIENELQLK